MFFFGDIALDFGLCESANLRIDDTILEGSVFVCTYVFTHLFIGVVMKSLNAMQVSRLR